MAATSRAKTRDQTVKGQGHTAMKKVTVARCIVKTVQCAPGPACWGLHVDGTARVSRVVCR